MGNSVAKCGLRKVNSDFFSIVITLLSQIEIIERNVEKYNINLRNSPLNLLK